MSTSTSSETSRKNARLSDVDRISNLPDGVISHILSNLPIKDAVKTSVLSRDWEFKWTSIYNLHLLETDFYPSGKDSPFPNIVEKLLLHLNNVKSFRLNCSNDYIPITVIASWISAAFRQHNIETVVLEIIHYINYEGEFALPLSLLSCTSLKNLLVEISGCILKVPAKCCFPNLRSLEFMYVKILNDLAGIGTLTFTLPTLEKLELYECEWSNAKCIEFFAPSLTTFLSDTSFDEGWPDVDSYSLKIIGCRLAKFKTNGVSIENFVLADSTVVQASLLNLVFFSTMTDAGILSVLGFQVRKLLRGVSSLQYLELSSCLLKAFAQSKVRLSLPTFSELKELKVSDRGSTDDLDADGLLEILHASPFLKCLEIQVNILRGYDLDAIKSVPSCILSHLEKIKLSYSSYSKKLHLGKLLLKNALELKNVYVSCHGHSRMVEILKRLSKFPKGSKCVAIDPDE